MAEKFVVDGEELEYSVDEEIEEYDPEQDIIALVDDENNEYEFEIIGELEYEDAVFYALSPLFEDKERGIIPDETYMIFEVITDENGEKKLAEVDDDLIDELEMEFNKMLNDDEADEADEADEDDDLFDGLEDEEDDDLFDEHEADDFVVNDE